jgi:hypothetical protein
MTRARTLGGLILVATGFALSSPACRDAERPPVWTDERDAGSDARDDAGHPFLDACAGGLTEAAPVPLDLYVMLDISASMLDTTGGGVSKWEAVTSALIDFVSDPGSRGHAVGIQYFPLEKPGTPETCSSDAECGESAPCYLNLCWNSPFLPPCSGDEDCGASDSCLPLAVCAEDDRFVCRRPGTECVDSSGASYGTCTLSTESFCVHSASCRVSDYATPAVPIGPLPGNVDALVASIRAQEPDGATPTGPALAGALETAREWATEHPDRSAAAVLVTDGVPTECDPVSIDDVAELAAAAVTGTPRIPTFVIGVFGPADGSLQNLQRIARAGGTDAFILDTTEDVAAELLRALSAIREARLSCEFELPEAPPGEALDFSAVNVQVTTSDGEELLYYVASADQCGKLGGWHYDTDPAIVAPNSIVLCPASCEALQGDVSASVELSLGCSTIVR